MVLTKQGDRVELDDDCEVSVKWESVGKLDSTRIDSRGEESIS